MCCVAIPPPNNNIDSTTRMQRKQGAISFQLSASLPVRHFRIGFGLQQELGNPHKVQFGGKAECGSFPVHGLLRVVVPVTAVDTDRYQRD